MSKIKAEGELSAEEIEMLETQAYAAENYDPADVAEVKIAYELDGSNLDYDDEGKLKV